MSLTDLRKSLQRREVVLPYLRNFLEEEAKAVQDGLKKKKEIILEDSELSIECFQERIEEFNHDLEEEQIMFHPSQIGQCLRKLWFKVKRHAAPNKVSKDSDPLKTYLIFEMGTYTHVFFQNLCARAGILIKREAPILDKKLGVVGHGDGILKLDNKRILLEIKTANGRNFAMLGDSPKLDHKQQATIYMKALKLKHASIIYINKDRQEAKEYFIDYDESFWLNSCLPRIGDYQNCVTDNDIPEREGNNVKGMPCLFCEYTDLCFNSRKLAAFHIANGTRNPDPECNFHIRLHEKNKDKKTGQEAGVKKWKVTGRIKRGDEKAEPAKVRKTVVRHKRGDAG